MFAIKSEFISSSCCVSSSVNTIRQLKDNLAFRGQCLPFYFQIKRLQGNAEIRKSESRPGIFYSCPMIGAKFVALLLVNKADGCMKDCRLLTMKNSFFFFLLMQIYLAGRLQASGEQRSQLLWPDWNKLLAFLFHFWLKFLQQSWINFKPSNFLKETVAPEKQALNLG